jgi:hypothetical protein
MSCCLHLEKLQLTLAPLDSISYQEHVDMSVIMNVMLAPSTVCFVHTILPKHSCVESKVPGYEDMDWYAQLKCVSDTYRFVLSKMA